MSQRIRLGVGVVLLVLGGFVLARGASFTSKRTMFEVGDWKAKVSEQRTVPPWVGAILVVAGVVLLAGASRRPS
jgi:hypothetical protein